MMSVRMHPIDMMQDVASAAQPERDRMASLRRVLHGACSWAAKGSHSIDSNSSSCGADCEAAVAYLYVFLDACGPGEAGSCSLSPVALSAYMAGRTDSVMGVASSRMEGQSSVGRSDAKVSPCSGGL